MSGWLVFAAGVLTLVGIYGLLAMALNLEFGMGGLIDLGIVAFFGIGSYAYTIIIVRPPGPKDAYVIGLNLPICIGLLGALLAGAGFAYLIGLPTLRLRGEYLAVATYAFSQVVEQIFANESWLTNGVIGFTALPQPFRHHFTGSAYQFILMLLVGLWVVAIFYLLSKLARSPFGRTIRAIRENEEVALAIGKNTPAFKMRCFMLSGALCALAGGIYTWYTTTVVPGLFSSEVTWTVWISLILGGSGNFKGALLGPLILLGVQEATRFFQAAAEMATFLAAIRVVTMGLLIVLVIRFKPKGILPEPKYYT